MAERSNEELFDEAEAEYTEPDDAEVIRGNREAYKNSSALAAFAASKAGVLLIKSTKEEISKSLQLLIETRKARHVSDIESNLNLLTKLTGAKNTAEAISQWLNSLVN